MRLQRRESRPDVPPQTSPGEVSTRWAGNQVHPRVLRRPPAPPLYESFRLCWACKIDRQSAYSDYFGGTHSSKGVSTRAITLHPFAASHSVAFTHTSFPREHDSPAMKRPLAETSGSLGPVYQRKKKVTNRFQAALDNVNTSFGATGAGGAKRGTTGTQSTPQERTESRQASASVPKASNGAPGAGETDDGLPKRLFVGNVELSVSRAQAVCVRACT